MKSGARNKEIKAKDLECSLLFSGIVLGPLKGHCHAIVASLSRYCSITVTLL